MRRKVGLDSLILGINLYLMGSKCVRALGLVYLFLKTTIQVGLVVL